MFERDQIACIALRVKPEIFVWRGGQVVALIFIKTTPTHIYTHAHFFITHTHTYAHTQQKTKKIVFSFKIMFDDNLS